MMTTDRIKKMKKNVLYTLIIISLFYAQNLFAEKGESTQLLNAGLLGPQTVEVEKDRYSKILFVSADRKSDEQGDGSKGNPWNSLGHALSGISDASEQNKYAIFVAEGTYSGQTVTMPEHVDIFGGFSSETWTRDIQKFKSHLDGKNVRRVVLGANNARLDGFIINNGLSRTHGGGILCDDTSPTISNNFIINNFVLEPANFNHNRIHQNGHIGGGIACLYNAVPDIRNNVFYGNRTSVGIGGALAFHGWVRHKDAPSMEVLDNRFSGGLRPKVEHNVFINNTAGVNDNSRTRSSSGGAIACAYEARPIIQNNLIALNRAMGNSDAGGIYCEYFSDPDIIGNWIIGNVGDDDGGGFYTMKLGQPLLKGNIFAGNYTTGGGIGGIRISKEGRARIIDNIIMHNPGGGVMSVDSYVELKNNLIASNRSGAGVNFRTNFSYFKPSVISQNIIVNNEGGAIELDKDSEKMVKMSGNTIKEEYPDDKSKYLERRKKEQNLKVSIASAYFDQTSFKTMLTMNDQIANNLTGRLVRLNNKWSIVQNHESNQLIIWGDLLGDSQDSKILNILPVYSSP